MLACVASACAADRGVNAASTSSTTGAKATTTMNETTATTTTTTTTTTGTTTTTHLVSEEERSWLHGELVRFVDDLEETGRLADAIAFDEPRCMHPLVPPSSHAVGNVTALGAMRFFIADRSERVEVEPPAPGAGRFDPDWEPTHWAVAIVLTYEDQDYMNLPQAEQAAEVVQVEVASFTIEPVPSPVACGIVERVDVTERLLPLLPKAFEMVPTG